MKNNNTYVIAPKSEFEKRLVQNESGEYTQLLIAEGKLHPQSTRKFITKGAIPESNDGLYVLLEEEHHMYLNEDLQADWCQIYTHDEIKEELRTNENWIKEEPL